MTKMEEKIRSIKEGILVRQPLCTWHYAFLKDPLGPILEISYALKIDGNRVDASVYLGEEKLKELFFTS